MRTIIKQSPHNKEGGEREMEENNDEPSLSILMLPWLAHGHINPFLELAKRLSQRNFHIYFCSTLVNLNSIKETLYKYTNIQLVELLLQSSPDLPPESHTTKNLPTHLIPSLIKAFSDTKPSVLSILDTHKPDLIIYDGFNPWLPGLALLRNIPAVHFVTSGATVMSFFYHRDVRGSDTPFPFGDIFLRDYEIKKLQEMHITTLELEDDEGDRHFAFTCFDRSHDIILIKSCRAIEGKYIDYLSFLCKKRLLYLGPLIPDVTDPTEYDAKDDEIIEWLNKKDNHSTVFVSFGSEYFLSKEEMKEIALGLELSGVNFIWVVRFMPGAETNLEDELPKGFLERVEARGGLVVEGWAPQAKILRNSSIGGFVSHCGWSSTMESIYFGVPLIGIPMQLDQFTNARMIMEVGIGKEVVRDRDGRLERGEVAKAVQEVVVGKEGESVRLRVRDIGERIRNKGEEDLDEAAMELRKFCLKKKHQENVTHSKSYLHPISSID